MIDGVEDERSEDQNDQPRNGYSKINSPGHCNQWQNHGRNKPHQNEIVEISGQIMTYHPICLPGMEAAIDEHSDGIYEKQSKKSDCGENEGNTSHFSRGQESRRHAHHGKSQKKLSGSSKYDGNQIVSD